MATKVEWYGEFYQPDYRPARDDLVVLFYFEPAKGISWKEAVGRIASESSAGTWTTLARLPRRIESVKAKAFEVKGNLVKVAYPLDLWDEGNMPQLLSGIAGNIFGMKALRNLRLLDASLPRAYTRHYPGPQFGISGLRKVFKAYGRPLTGAVPKPKIGWSAAEHAEVAFETWMGGFDLCKDDENLTSTPFNRFEERVRLMTKMREKAEKLTGETKSALLNITAETREMERRAKMLHEYGWEYAMVDVVTVGAAGVQTAREFCGDYRLAIHAHRAMHAAFDRNPRHGMTMQFLAKINRLMGVDQIHAGTVVGKLVGGKREVLNNQKVLSLARTPEGDGLLEQDWGSIKPAFPVASGGLHPGLVPMVLHHLGNDIVLLVSGGIHGHPKGTRAGAKAAVQAIEAFNQGTGLEEHAKRHPELAQALEKWGHLRPR
jgi:ribulose-bisphosphate carboxylase large chain